jgi:N6-adenosine-specific RNA methylase IME4
MCRTVFKLRVLSVGTYRSILVDPPWPYKENFAQIHSKAGRVEKPLPYPSMSVEDIMALPVRTLAESDCRLFLWTTNRFLPDSFRVLIAWGFEYRQTIVWHKDGNPSPWGGSVAPNHAEFLMVATVGKPERLAMWKSNVLSVNVARHSQKPEVFQDLVERVSAGPYLEMFARRYRMGWDVWGNEVDSSVRLERAI